LTDRSIARSGHVLALGIAAPGDGFVALEQTWVVAIITGGIIEEWGKPKVALRDVMQQVRRFKPRQLDDEYAVDVAFRSWDPRRTPEFTGVMAAMVGRKQRRFIVWHSVPIGLETSDAVRSWLVSVLPETARLVREHLPTKSKAYPAEELAIEIEQLRAALMGPEPCDR
jgi:hypothetical protein